MLLEIAHILELSIKHLLELSLAVAGSECLGSNPGRQPVLLLDPLLARLLQRPIRTRVLPQGTLSTARTAISGVRALPRSLENSRKARDTPIRGGHILNIPGTLPRPALGRGLLRLDDRKLEDKSLDSAHLPPIGRLLLSALLSHILIVPRIDMQELWGTARRKLLLKGAPPRAFGKFVRRWETAAVAA